MHAGIVGMGIMGRLLALGLHRAGWNVSLFDQSGTTNCSFAAAGLLTPFSELDRATALISDLGQESVQRYWPEIIKLLPESTYFQNLGTLVLSHPRDESEWHIFSQRIQHQMNKKSFIFQSLNRLELMQLEPELRSFENSYYFPNEAHIDCQSVMLNLQKYFDMHQIRYQLNSEIVALDAKVITAKTNNYHFDMVFDCRGLGANASFPPLRALRGELLWLHAPEVFIKRPLRFLHPRYNLYIVPRPENIYLIGASEIEAEDYSAISVRTTLELLTAAYYMHPGFAEARIIKTVTHCRPTLSHHLPRIKLTDGLLAVNGLYRHGYLLAPALVQEILRGLENTRFIRYPTIWEYHL